MKRALFALIAASIALAFGACNRHSWDESKKLFEKHESGHGHEGDHDREEGE